MGQSCLALSDYHWWTMLGGGHHPLIHMLPVERISLGSLFEAKSSLLEELGEEEEGEGHFGNHEG